MGSYEDFKKMKAYFNLSNEDIAEITGLSLNSIKRSAGRQDFSRYFKLTLWVFNKMIKDSVEKK
jgi:hypothetical protein